MSTFIHKPQTLIERKKQQWAREKEELSHLGTPWGKDFVQIRCSRNTKQLWYSISRTKQLPRCNSNTDLLTRHETRRKTSLPPINQSPNSSYDEAERDFGGETSGYGSDNANHTPEGMWKEQLSNRWEVKPEVKFWENADDYSKMNDAPGWVKRGLQRNVELIVANSSPSESPEQDYKHDFDHDRPSTGSSTSQTRSFVRGQNISLDPVEIAEREQKRQRALAHQEAIKQQLEEKERKKREEKERRMREEQEEELRLQREQEIERKRLEEEQQLLKDKQEREQKRKEAMREALELAQKQAEERRKQKSRSLKVARDETFEIIEANNNTIVEEGLKENLDEKAQEGSSTATKNDTHQKEINSACRTEVEPSPNKNENVPSNSEKETNTPRIDTSVKSLQTSNFSENLTLVMQTPAETLNSMQFAVLMPTFGNASSTVVPIAVPITLNDDSPSTRTINRVLTPSTYRHRRFCDSSTQTDNSNLHNKKYSHKCSIQIRNFYDHDTRSRRGSRTETVENLTDRPKWGANRPHTRYLKQSEKDLFYQRRKSRAKRCQSRSFDDKNNNYSAHSSDDSETVSANVYSNNGLIKKRSRGLWQKTENIRGTNLLKTEIIPLEAHNDQIYYKTPNCEKCFCRCHVNNNHADTIRTEGNEVKDNTCEKIDINLNNLNDIQAVNKITNTFQNQLTVKEEMNSNSSNLNISNDSNKDNSL